MGDPPTDDDGYVTPHDDHQTIPNESFLVRQIHRQWVSWNSDGTIRVSTKAFSGSSPDRDRYEGMSVEMLDKLESDGIDPRERLRPGHIGAVNLQAGRLRQFGLQVGPDPMKVQDPYHASVWGVTQSLRKTVHEGLVWLVMPEAPD